MTTPAPRADCSRCAALCCVAFAFDKSEAFAIDKPADTPCPNLGPRNRCRIHDKRKAKGFSGCIGYDCAGAGQRVTQDLFDGRSWRDDLSLLQPMTEAFADMRAAIDLEDLLAAASALPLNAADQNRLSDLQAAFTAQQPWTRQSLPTLHTSDLPAKIKTFLTSLKRYVETQ